MTKLGDALWQLICQLTDRCRHAYNQLPDRDWGKDKAVFADSFFTYREPRIDALQASTELRFFAPVTKIDTGLWMLVEDLRDAVRLGVPREWWAENYATAIKAYYGD